MVVSAVVASVDSVDSDIESGEKTTVVMGQTITLTKFAYLQFLAKRSLETGSGIGFRELCDHFGTEGNPVEKNTVTGHLLTLRKKGLIVDDPQPKNPNKQKHNSARPVPAYMAIYNDSIVPASGNCVCSTSFAIVRLPDNRIVFMRFNADGIVGKIRFETVSSATTIADNCNIDSTLPLLDRLAAVAVRIEKRENAPAT